MNREFKYFVQNCIRNNKNELTQEKALEAVKERPYNFKYLTKYAKWFSKFKLDSYLIEFALSKEKCNFYYLIKYYTKTDRDELTQPLVKEMVYKDLDHLYIVLFYCKTFKDFYLDPELIEYVITEDRSIFYDLTSLYIDTNRDDLDKKIANKIIKENPDNFEQLLRYYSHFD